MANYRFKTVMVSDYDRSMFTYHRDSISEKRVTDKELFAAMMELADFEAIRELVLQRKAEAEASKASQKIEKLKQKLAELEAQEEVEAEEASEEIEEGEEIAA